jgi:DNA integrity scanning protein DisA with diadenylate cyclase activity
VNLLTRSLVRHAHAIAREVGARVVLLAADVVEEDHDLVSLIEDVDFRVILVSRRHDFVAPEGWGDLCAVVRVPNLPMSRAGLVKVATLVATVENLIHAGDRIVWLTGLGGSGTLDTIIVLNLGTEIEMFSTDAADPLPPGVKPEVFQRLLALASQLAMEGREGRPVGTLFVLGASDEVLAQSRQLVINPFHGYPETERNILDPRLEETIKEFSAIDGAYIIRGDGVILSAGRYLIPQGQLVEPLPQGLGARHEAAAGITILAAAIALSISQSTGTISIFRQGRLLTDIQKPRSGAVDEF